MIGYLLNVLSTIAQKQFVCVHVTLLILPLKCMRTFYPQREQRDKQGVKFAGKQSKRIMPAYPGDIAQNVHRVRRYFEDDTAICRDERLDSPGHADRRHGSVC